MPFVDPATANNLSSDAIASIKHRNGSGTWRERISATNEHRTVLLHWPPGTAQAAHYHPACEEVFVIHEGCAEFTFNDANRSRPIRDRCSTRLAILDTPCASLGMSRCC